MDRRRSPTPLTARSSFEATRLGARCLAEARERLVPTTRRLLHPPRALDPGEGAAPTTRRDERA